MKRSGGAPTRKDFAILEANSACYDPGLLRTVRAALEVQNSEGSDVRIKLPTPRLAQGMSLAEDVVTRNGQLILARGSLLSAAHIERLRYLAQYEYILDEISIMLEEKALP